MNVGRTSSGPVVVVTGGAGFLGRALVRELRKASPDAVLDPRELRVLTCGGAGELSGVTYVRGDILEPDDLRRTFAGADLVFHLAALIDVGQNAPERVHAVNATGTRNVVEACRAAGVPALVATSSLDVIYSGHSIHDADETTPYPSSYPSAYCVSKAEGERAVRDADGTALAGRGDRRLRTIVVRPGSIWGEGDPYHVGAMVELARRGPVVRLGRESAPTHFTYVGNVAHAVALAGRALLEGREEAVGQVYFVSDFAPRNFFDHLEPVVRAAGGRTARGRWRCRARRCGSWAGRSSWPPTRCARSYRSVRCSRRSAWTTCATPSPSGATRPNGCWATGRSTARPKPGHGRSTP